MSTSTDGSDDAIRAMLLLLENSYENQQTQQFSGFSFSSFIFIHLILHNLLPFKKFELNTISFFKSSIRFLDEIDIDSCIIFGWKISKRICFFGFHIDLCWWAGRLVKGFHSWKYEKFHLILKSIRLWQMLWNIVTLLWSFQSLLRRFL